MSEETSIAECTLCATYYKTFRKLRRHFKKRHADLKVLQCYFCDYITHDKVMLKQHKERSHADIKFVCKKCDFKTRKWTRMKRHFVKHKTIKPITELSSSEDLSSTSRVKEAVQKKKKKQIKKEKFEEKRFNCDFCDKCFESKIKLKEHVPVHSLDRSPEHLNLSLTVNGTDHSTSGVKETFRGNMEENKQQEIHYKPLACKICKKRFRNESTLAVHSMVHSEDRPYKCTLCDYAGKWKGNLSLHMKVHSDDRPFKCTLCEHKVKNANHLKSHIKVHLNQRDFACEICDYKTFTRQTLRSHIRVHTGEKPYKCHFCENAFSQSSSLHRHLRRFHQDLSNMKHSNPQQ